MTRTMQKLKLPALVVTVLIAFGAAASPAVAAEGKGTVKGKVVKADGSPAVGAEVELAQRPDRKSRNAADNAAQAQPEGAKQRKPRQPAVAQATTDADGKFTLSNVPAGQYVVRSRVKREGQARQPVTVHADTAADVTLTLKAGGQRKGNKGAGNKQTRAERRQARRDGQQ